VTANIETPRKEPRAPYRAVQVAASDRTAKGVTKQMLGHFSKAGVPPKRIVKEFPVSADAMLPVGECNVNVAASFIYQIKSIKVQVSRLYISYQANISTSLQTRKFHLVHLSVL